MTSTNNLHFSIKLGGIKIEKFYFTHKQTKK